MPLMVPLHSYAQDGYRWSIVPLYGISNSKGSLAAPYRTRPYHFYQKNTWRKDLQGVLGVDLQLELLQSWKVEFGICMSEHSSSALILHDTFGGQKEYLNDALFIFSLGAITSLKVLDWQLRYEALQDFSWKVWLGVGFHFDYWPYFRSYEKPPDSYYFYDLKISAVPKDRKIGGGRISLNLSTQLQYKNYWSGIIGIQYGRVMNPVYQVKYQVLAADGRQDHFVANLGTHQFMAYASLPLRFWSTKGR